MAGGAAHLKTRDLTVVFGKVVAVRDVSLAAREGETVAIFGANGSGKTTFLKAVAGLGPAPRGKGAYRGGGGGAVAAGGGGAVPRALPRGPGPAALRDRNDTEGACDDPPRGARRGRGVPAPRPARHLPERLHRARGNAVGRRRREGTGLASAPAFPPLARFSHQETARAGPTRRETSCSQR